MLTIINTGGTFNKIYDPIKGDLTIPKDNIALHKALKYISKNHEFDITGVVYKDSLEMSNSDREIIYNHIKCAKYNRVIVIHGTDTMDITAKYIDDRLKSDSIKKSIVLTGAMVPLSIDPIDATSNLSFAIASIPHTDKGVYISMHGLCLPYDKIVKNRLLGVFEEV